MDSVSTERNELEAKIKWLVIFLNSDAAKNLTSKTYDLLHRKYEVMNKYSEILKEQLQLPGVSNEQNN